MPSSSDRDREAWDIAKRVAQRASAGSHMLDPQEALSDACLGAAKACRSFDPSRGVPFSAWVTLRAKSEILDGRRDRSPLTRGEHARGITLEQRPAAQHPAHLDVAALIPGQRGPSDLERVDDRDQIDRLLATLPTRHAHVVNAYYFDERTQVEISRDLGVTESRVSQLRHEALELLRDAA